MFLFDRTTNHETAVLNLLFDPWCLEPSNYFPVTVARYHIRGSWAVAKQFGNTFLAFCDCSSKYLQQSLNVVHYPVPKSFNSTPHHGRTETPLLKPCQVS